MPSFTREGLWAVLKQEFFAAADFLREIGHRRHSDKNVYIFRVETVRSFRRNDPRSEPDAGERRIEKRIIVRGPAPHATAEILFNQKSLALN